jgi:AcrR family transcriptional regulator
MPAPLAPALDPSSRAATERSRETQERLLDAAERLFAERGFDRTSLRALARAAGTSLSAAHYHFGSKQGLLRATLLRRVGPVNRGRLERLEVLERQAAGGPVRLEAILEAFLRPALEVRAASTAGPSPLRQVAARLYSDPPELVAALKRELFGPVNDRFVSALARALPDHPREGIALGFQLTVGAMVHVIGGHLAGAGESGGAQPGNSDQALLRSLVAFAAAGLRAAAATDASAATGGDAA